MVDNLLLVVVLAAGVFAPVSAWFAAQRSRRPAVWFLFGALIGPLALALLAFAPPGRCPSCDAPVEGWPSTCRQCGRSLGLDQGPAVPVRTAPAAGELDGNVVDPTQRSRRSRPRATSARATRTSARDLGSSSGPLQESTAGEVLTTGIYLSGNAGLEIGACYALSRVPAPEGDHLRVFGPVDAGQITIRHEGPLLDFDVTGVEDRVIISGRQGRSPLMCVFRAIGGMHADDLERALNGSSVSRP